ncbi:MBL fold metallo-hydrolase [bacterium]|nr:MBL fold metallo-hydrolase [bacterium]
MKKIFAVFLFLSICFICLFLYINTTGCEPEIYILKYGQSQFNEKYIFLNGQDKLVPFIWTFFVVKDKTGIFLIDTGIADKKFLKLWKIRNYISPINLLNRIGIKKENIDGIILTHLHADHCDGLSLFKGVPVYLQQNEYDAMNRAFKQTNKKFSHGYYRCHFDLINEAKQNGNLILIKKDKKISRNIWVKSAPYHTAGTQTVIVKKGRKRIYFVPDNAYFYKNISELMPVGIVYDAAGDLAYLKKLSAFDPSKKIIVPAHDPEVFNKFKNCGEAVLKIE